MVRARKMRLSGFLKGDYTTGTRSHLGHRKTATGMKKDEKDDQDSNNLVTILTFHRLLVRLLLALVSSTKVLVGQFQQISFKYVCI